MGEILPERRWRACFFTELNFRNPNGQKFLFMVSSWGNRKFASDSMWNYRSVVKSQKWLSWIEWEGITDAERPTCVPLDVRDYCKANNVDLWKPQ